MLDKELKFTHSFVRNILKEIPETRNSDRRLMLEVWERGGLHLTDHQKYLFMRLPSAESIRRARQKIQESGVFLADDSVKQERLFQEKEIRKCIK